MKLEMGTENFKQYIKNKCVLNQIFFGMTYKRLKCDKCGFDNDKHEQFSVLPIPKT